MKRAILVLALAFGFATIGLCQQDLSKVEIKITKVAGSVYMLEGAGGNIGVSVGEDGILIVDDQYAPLAPKIQAALKGISSKPVKYVINTHWHGDHTGGNEVFGATAPIIAHANVRKRLIEGNAERKTPPAPKGALPVITFDDKLDVHINGEDIRAVHFPPGHTDGDVVVYFTSANVVHMGDDFFNGRFPFIDLASGGSVKGLIANVEKIARELPADAKVIPGHGPLARVKDLQTYVAMLKDTSSLFAQAMKDGATLDQLKNNEILKKYDSWSWEFIKADTFTEILYEDNGGK